MNSENRLVIIRQRLTEKLSPTHLEIIDETHKHKNHPGAKTGLGHFAITIASPKFSGKNSLQCHKLVYDALGELMQTDIHALKIRISKTV